MSDSAVLTVVVLTPWQQNHSESAFLHYIRPHGHACVSRVLSQSAFNRLARDLLGVLGTLGPLLSRRPGRLCRSPVQPPHLCDLQPT